MSTYIVTPLYCLQTIKLSSCLSRSLRDSGHAIRLSTAIKLLRP